MNEQIRLAAGDAAQPMHRRALSTSQPFELPSRPSCEGLVQVTKDQHTLRSIKPTVVVDPATYRWIDEPRQILQALVVPVGRHPPFANGGSDRLGGLSADRGKKAHEELSPAILRPPRLKGVAQEVERNMFVLPTPIIVLAVDDPGLHRMKLQTALRKPISDGCQHQLGLPPAPAMHDGVVRVALERDARIVPLHPQIKRVVEKQVGQQRTDDTTLRRALAPRLQGSIHSLYRGTEPPPNVQTNPRHVGVVGHGALDQIMIQTVKERFDVQIDHPVSLPASFPRHPHRVERRSARSIAVRIAVEHRLHHRLQHHLHDRLRNSIGNRGNAEWTHAAVSFRYLDEPHRRREVRARRHPIPDLVQVPLQIFFECRQRLAIHARCTAVRLHPLIRFPNALLRHVVGLRLRHRLLPSLVGLRLQPDRRAPSLHPRYQASPLLRTRPSLRLALVLGSSWVFHLEFSLGIEATGSHVLHKSLSWARAAFMPVTTRAVSRFPSSFVPSQRLELGSDDIPTLSTRLQRFTHVRLPSSHLTG